MSLKGKIQVLFAILILSFSACKKEEVDGRRIGDNDSPYYDGIPTVLVQNYVNRLYIDLIGREPLDVEMESDVEFLKENKYSFDSRDSIIVRLQEDLTFREGDSSYKAAYYNRLYELFKVKMLEGASDGDINREIGLLNSSLIRDSIAGDWYKYQIDLEKIQKLENVLNIDEEYMEGTIDLTEIFSRLLDNAVYDRINMNTFNFINASFNDLFDRFPSRMEFDAGFEIVEYDKPAQIFGLYATNKGEYIQILCNSDEFYEGLIRWTYGTLMARPPETEELEKAMATFNFDHDLQKLQRAILVTDEYANFEQ